MQAPATGYPKREEVPDSPAQALVRLLEQHGLEESLREILAAMQAGKEERQQQARLGLLEHLLEGQAPLTPEELEGARREWQA